MTRDQGAIFLRVLTGLCLAGATMALVWVPVLAPGFAAFVAVLAYLGLTEFYALSRAKDIRTQSVIGALAGGAIALSGYWGNLQLTVMLLFAAAMVLACLHLRDGGRGLADLASSVFGVLYVGWFAAHLVLLHQWPVLGPSLATLLVAAVVLSDCGAYFTGSALGKHKLAPSISPNKTWEGALGGVLWAALGVAALLAAGPKWGLDGLPSFSWWHYVFTGAALSAASQIGDLTESMLKRGTAASLIAATASSLPRPRYTIWLPSIRCFSKGLQDVRRRITSDCGI